MGSFADIVSDIISMGQYIIRTSNLALHGGGVSGLGRFTKLRMANMIIYGYGVLLQHKLQHIGHPVSPSGYSPTPSPHSTPVHCPKIIAATDR